MEIVLDYKAQWRASSSIWKVAEIHPSLAPSTHVRARVAPPCGVRGAPNSSSSNGEQSSAASSGCHIVCFAVCLMRITLYFYYYYYYKLSKTLLSYIIQVSRFAFFVICNNKAKKICFMVYVTEVLIVFNLCLLILLTIYLQARCSLHVIFNLAHIFFLLFFNIFILKQDF